METLLDLIVEAILYIFPEAGDMPIATGTRLGDIPEWDSMNAVNLQTYLDKRYDVHIPLEKLTEDTTMEELMHLLRAKMTDQRNPDAAPAS